MRGYGKTSTMRYKKRGSGSRNGSYKGISRGYKRPRSTGAFNSKVKKANLSSAEMKNLSMCIMEAPLVHNTWHKGGSKTVDAVGGDAAITLAHAFENILTHIKPGVTDHTRIGNEVYIDRMKLRLFLANDILSPSVAYRII